ncbi:MAG: DUF262 domain-containing protein [Candidatus Brocadia sp. WS118]|nr:MAG: DUF262 domain-containing protein [Candidatus Brocadia sp. WS118]
MQAKETKLQDIIEGTKQYVIPLFQRTYSWTNKEWEILWKDLIELCETENPRSHFIGSIVNMPTVSVPEGVAKYLLIDGQQRLTTIFVLLTLLRNKARENKNPEFADEINNTLLVNPYKKENDFFKLMPTQVDRDAYINLINGKPNGSENQITRAYTFFEKKLRQVQFEHEKLKKIITSYFSVVSIVLDADDNPHLVFESLNAKGRPLTQADLIRRFVCNVPTNQLNKIFTAVYPQLIAKHQDDFAEGIKIILQSRGYPKDNEFFSRFKEAKFYGGGDRQIKTKLILETLEESFAHKETVPFDNLTIEHVMPQTLSEWWQNHLGDDWEETHELFLHTIGNLTLSAYNTELSNDDFTTKKQTYNESHLDLNKYFSPISSWTRSEIEKRAEVLSKQSLEIWSYFGQEKTASSDLKEVTGTTPRELKILGQRFQVQTWRDVLEQTLNTVADLEPDKFEIIAHNFPRYLGKDKNKFREIRRLQNGYFIEVNLSAQNIQKFCYQAMETIELTSDDWSVMVT